MGNNKTREKSNKYFLVGLLIILAVAGYFIWQGTLKQTSLPTVPSKATDALQKQRQSTDSQSNSILSVTDKKSIASQNSLITSQDSITTANWKTYTNDKFGFTFKYPFTWVKNGKEAEVVDLSGTTSEIDIDFKDTLSKTTLAIAYHLPPKGTELYKYNLSQYSSSQGWYAKERNETKVAGRKAIVASRNLTENGRGQALNPSIKSIIVDFLDNKQTGEFEFEFQTTSNKQDREITKFNQLLSSFKFIN